MSTVFGLLFVFFAFTYFKDAMDPSKLSRLRVQAMCATLGVFSLLIASVLIFGGANSG